MLPNLKLKTGAPFALLGLLLAHPAVAADNDAALGLMPPDTAVVVGVNLDHFRKTPLFADFQKLMESQPDAKKKLDEFKEAGMDPRSNLDKVLIAIPASIQKTKGPLIVFPGHGDLKKLLEVIKKDPNAKVTPGNYKGVETFSSGDATDKGTFAVLKNNLIVGPDALVQATIDASKAGGKGAAGNAQIKKLVSGTDTGKDLWAVVQVTPELSKQVAAGNPDMARLKTARASLDFASGLALRAALEFADAATAKKTADDLKAKAMQAAGAPQMAMLGLGDALKKMAVDAKDKELNVGLDLSQAEVDHVKSFLMAMSAGMAGAQHPTPPGGPGMMPPPQQQLPPPAPAPATPKGK